MFIGIDKRRRHVDEDRAIGAAMFEDEHAVAAVLAEAIGEHAPGRARADDHVVEGIAVLVHVELISLR